MTDKKNKLIVFQGKKIRRVWHNDDWYYSVVDICGVLTDSADSGAYWRKLKQRLKQEGSEVVTICHGLKIEAPDGKKRVTDCSNTKGVFRIIQSIPSKKDYQYFGLRNAVYYDGWVCVSYSDGCYGEFR